MLTSVVQRNTHLQKVFRLFSTRIQFPDMEVVQGEKSVGIQVYTCKEFPGFAGILKQRYTDFIVREIDVNGNVAQLHELNAKAVEDAVFNQESGKDTGSDSNGLETAELVDLFVEKMKLLVTLDENSQTNMREFLVQCLSKHDDCPNEYIAFPCTVKETRTAAHKAIKAIVPAYIDSDTFNVDGVQHMRLIAKHKRRGKKRRRDQWPSGVGDFLKFKILKENIDTMSAANYMSQTLNCKKDFLKFSGTKDKRAVTVQWATAYRLHPIALHRFNSFRFPPTIRCGDFEYVKEPLQLGKLCGNRFEIVLREVSCEAGLVESSCRALAERGFINYYGLQRFGKGGAGNHLIGRALLQSDWKGAIDFMFATKSGERDEVVKMKEHYRNGDYAQARAAIPSFSYYSEKYCLQGLCASPLDYFGAFQRIPRNTKFICGHAFQSYVWNMAASERVRTLGLGVAIGDLVFLSPDVELEEVGDDVMMGGSEEKVDEKVASIACVTGEDINESVHVVTEEDVASGRFSSTDIVLPLLGFNSLFPSNEVGPFIQKILSDNDISLEVFRKHPFFQFSGSYRRVFSRPGNFEWSTLAYSERNTDLLATELKDFPVKSKENRCKDQELEQDRKEDVDEVKEKEEKDEEGSAPKYLAAVLKFSLPAGSYATMLLREVMKTSTESGFHSALTSSSKQAQEDTADPLTSSAAGSPPTEN